MILFVKGKREFYRSQGVPVELTNISPTNDRNVNKSIQGSKIIETSYSFIQRKKNLPPYFPQPVPGLQLLADAMMNTYLYIIS